jgi:hypothetical protein
MHLWIWHLGQSSDTQMQRHWPSTMGLDTWIWVDVAMNFQWLNTENGGYHGIQWDMYVWFFGQQIDMSPSQNCFFYQMTVLKRKLCHGIVGSRFCDNSIPGAKLFNCLVDDLWFWVMFDFDVTWIDWDNHTIYFKKNWGPHLGVQLGLLTGITMYFSP